MHFVIRFKLERYGTVSHTPALIQHLSLELSSDCLRSVCNACSYIRIKNIFGHGA